MPFFQHDDVSLYYERQGSGPPLLALMGTGSDLRHPANFFLSPIAQEFDVLLFDQRGQGRSSKPERPAQMKDYALDAIAIARHMGWDRCHVLGISFGGMVAQEVCLRAPQMVDKLVLCCCASGGEGGHSAAIEDLPRSSPLEFARSLLPLYDRRIDPLWRYTFPKQYERKLEQLSERLSTGWGEPGHAIGLQRQLEARATHDTSTRLHQLTAPTLLCGGLYDALVPSSCMEYLHQKLPNAQLQWFEGGHLFMMEDPRSHIVILDFLEGV